MTRSERKAQTRQKIKSIATNVFRTLGFDRATMRDIANTASMSTGAIFANFKDKADLYQACFGHAPDTGADASRLRKELNAVLAELERVTGHLEAFARDHTSDATAETWAAIHCARQLLPARSAAA